MTPRIWLIAGPTASGKSALALALAERLGGEIVGADSMQLYRDLPILTARPTDTEMARISHHLVGVADAADRWSTGRWLRAARAVLEGLGAQGKSAIVAGGTGLYFRALTQGLVDLPEIAPEVRAAAEARWVVEGEAAVRARLGDSAAHISAGDRQRLVRALEVLEGTGRSLADWQAETPPAPFLGEWRGAVIEPPRDQLYRRCDERLEEMIEAGALAEVRALMARSLDPNLPAMKSVGVREFAAHLRGEISLSEALERAQRETRRYAKRQLTWLRNQAPGWQRLPIGHAEAQVAALL